MKCPKCGSDYVSFLTIFLDEDNVDEIQCMACGYRGKYTEFSKEESEEGDE